MSYLHPIDRRQFLGAAGLGAIAPQLVLGEPGVRSRRARPLLVVVYLRGGQDGLNAVVPYADDDYYRRRPTIAIPADGDGAALKLDRTFGLHPELAPLIPLWERKALAAVVCTGSDHPTRSHFDAQDFMEYAAPGLRTVRDGWLNRYLTATSNEQGDDPLRAIAAQGLLPRSLRGGYPVLALPSDSLGKEARLLDEFEALYGSGAAADEQPAMREPRRDEPPGPDEVKAAGRATVTALRRYQEIAKLDTGSTVQYPRGRLGAGLRRIAHLVRAEAPLEVACVDFTGWDHHIGEGGVEGLFARKLATLGGALRAFTEDLGEHLDRTLVLTMTEFGRTCAENGNAGTDHGHGGMMLAIGGGVAGGQVLGEWTGLEDDALYQGRDLRVTTDFRDVMAEVLRDHCAFELPKHFFPEFEPRRARKRLGLIAKR